jgi:tripartite-type tricarboxylate transporter receptor subunit TctC
LASALGAIGTGSITAAYAQSWPQRPVKVIVAFAAGGNSDLIARIVCERLSEAFGQNFFIENQGSNGRHRRGRGGDATPDGYTLFMARIIANGVTALKPVRCDPVQDFAAISKWGSSRLG